MTQKQRTIASGAVIRGIGLQTGKAVNLTLEPAPRDSGVVFIRTDLPNAPRIEVKPGNLKETGRFLQRTVIREKKAEVHTTEHLLAALSGLSVDNIFIKIDNMEVPGLDGSAKDFVKALTEAGIQRQDAPRKFLEIKRPFILSDNKSSIQVIPDEQFRLEYFLDYDHPLLREQWFDIIVEQTEVFSRFFEDEVAPSRTFCFEKDAAMLLKLGLGKGADFSNTLVIGRDGPIDNRFRFPNEPARHKLLDLLGDLYILGRHIKGRVIAKKSGHKLNKMFVKKVREEMEKDLCMI